MDISENIVRQLKIHESFNTFICFKFIFRYCSDFKLRSDFANLLSSMSIDCSSDYLLEHIIPSLEKSKNPGDHEPATMISILITKNIRKLAIQYKREDTYNTYEYTPFFFKI